VFVHAVHPATIDSHTKTDWNVLGRCTLNDRPPQAACTTGESQAANLPTWSVQRFSSPSLYSRRT